MEISVAGTSQVDGSLLAPGSMVTLPIITGRAVTSSPNGTTTIINVPIIRDGTFLNAAAIPTSQGLVIATAGPDGTGTMFLDPSQVAVITQNGHVATSFVPIENAELGESGQEPVNNCENLPDLSLKAKPQAANDAQEIKPPVGRGPFRCEVCEKFFTKWNQLQRHIRSHADDKPHRCDQCNLSFNVASNLLLHKATHQPDNPTCPECGKRFSRVASLKSHIMMHEREENLMCEDCGDEFATQSQLEKHLKQHMQEELEKKVHICKKCDFLFPKASLLREHMKVHYRIKVSLSHRNYKRNIDRSAFSHKCHNCGKTFQKPSQLKRHARIHTGERPFVCEQCGKSFNQKGALQIHLAKHSGLKPYRCEFCPAAFSQKGNLRAHIQRVHIIEKDGGPDQTVYCCEECTCVFKKLGSLNAHVSRMHPDDGEASLQPKGDVSQPGGGKIVKDVIKQLMFLSSQTQNTESPSEPQNDDALLACNSDILQQALQNSGLTGNQADSAGTGIPTSILRATLKKEADKPIHHSLEIGMNGPEAIAVQVSPAEGMPQGKSQEAQPHTSDMISYMLKRHPVRKVGGIRWHQCLECSKEFKKPSDLVRHIRIHTHEKPYKCLQCFRSFAVKSTLTAHTRTHSGVKLYKCHLCNKPFATHGSLKVHLRLHTGARPFDCPHCDKRFRTSGHRKSHLVSHMKDGEPRKVRRTVKRVARAQSTLPDVPLQEPILITDAGLVQNMPGFNQFTGENAGPDRPYKCSCCSRAFKKSSHLKQHVRSHTGEKPYRCLVCMRKFVSGGVLKAHMRTHSGLKAFRCQVCSTSFTTNGSLKRHMSIHSEIRPFMCPYCQKTFKTSVNCKKHMKTHKHELALQAAQANGAATTIADGIGEPSLNSQVNITSNEVENAEADETDGDIESPDMVTASLEPQNITLSGTLEQFQHTLDQQVFSEHATLTDPEKALQVQETVAFDQQAFEQFTSTSYTLQADQIQHTLDLAGLGNAFVQNNTIMASTNMSNILSTQDTGCQTLPDDVEVSSDDNQPLEEKPSKRNYKCSYCSKGFKKSSHLKQHIRTHTGEKPYKCGQCNRMCVSMGVLKAHMRTHSGVKDYKCHICQATFTTNGSLTRHKLIHNSGRRPYKCPHCPQAFRTSINYQRHFRIHTAAPEENTMDETDQENLGRKVKSNFIQFSDEQTVKLAKQQPEECATISEKILIASAAEKDRVSEIKDKEVEIMKQPKFPHMCHVCPKSFKKPSDLVRHTRIHTGEKPFTCSLCNKCFTVKSTLDSHLKTHTGEKQFNCHVCSSLFATKGSLKVHMRLHTGAKPFKCPHCEKRFRTSGHRKSHIVTHFKSMAQIPKKRRPIHRMVHAQKIDSSSLDQEDKLDEAGPADILGEVISDQNMLQTDLLNGVTSGNVLANITLSLDGLGADGGEGIQIAGLESGMITQTIQIDASLLQQLQQQGNFNITINGMLPGLQLDDTTVAGGASLATAEMSGGASNNLILQPLNITFPLNTQSQMLIPVEQDNGETGYQLTLDPPTDGELGKESTEVNLHITESSEMVAKVQVLKDADRKMSVRDGRTRAAPRLREVADSTKLLPYPCSACDKRFVKPSQLKRHMRIHTGERPFECTMCEKAFNQKNALQVHMNRHTGERPHQCPFCPMSFVQKGNLNVHVRRAHCESEVELGAEGGQMALLDDMGNIIIEVDGQNEEMCEGDSLQLVSNMFQS